MENKKICCSWYCQFVFWFFSAAGGLFACRIRVIPLGDDLQIVQRAEKAQSQIDLVSYLMMFSGLAFTGTSCVFVRYQRRDLERRMHEEIESRKRV